MRQLNVGFVVRQLVWSAACVLAAGTISAAEAAADDELEQVVVTGSRIAVSGFSTPTPVTVLGAEAIQELGITNIGAGANQLPAFRATTTPTTNGFGSFNVGAQIVNLRGLGVTRNLVLVDGRRFAPVTREGTVDLNLVPSGLVERLEVVTGGASAAYGSDAVAGAVNVILDKDLTGIKVQADYGVTAKGDGQNYHYSLAGGASFAGGRGHFILGGEYAKQEGIGDCFTRDYCQNSVVVAGAGTQSRFESGGGFIANPRGVINSLNNANSLPNNPAGVASVTTANSIRVLAGTNAISFDAAGNVVPYRLGTPASGSTGVGPDTTSSYTTVQLEVPVDRYATFGHAYFDFTDNLRGFVEGSFGHVNGEVDQSRYFGAAVPIFADNPFIPGAIRALLPAASATPSGIRPTTLPNFNLAVLGQRRGHSASKADSMRATTGLKAKLNEKWTWDAYYQFAHTDRFQSVENNLVTGAPRQVGQGSAGISNATSTAYWYWANDAVYNPADASLPAGQRRIVCRATISPDAALRSAAAGCVPFNPFGSQASQAALDYVYRTLTEDIHIHQHVVATNVQGEVADLWAGPLSVAAGIEYRHDATSLQHDSLSNAYAYFQNFGADYNARQDVTEGYVETELPLARDLPLVRALNVNGAIRRTRYDISGFGSPQRASAANKLNATTWKVGVIWEPLDWARFRFTTSRDIRAPNFNELFQASASTFGSVINRFSGNSSQNPVLMGGGNPNLQPEEGRTTTVGLVMQPDFIEGLSVSLDYYRIKVNGYIGTPGGAQNIVDRCFNLNDQDLCPLITFGANQSLAEVRNVNVNLQWLHTSGLDIEAAYRLPLARFSALPGTMSFRLLASRTYELSTNLFGVVTDRAGEIGGAGGSPTWLATLNTGYSNGPFTGTLTTRYIRGGVLNAAWYEPGQRVPVSSGASRVNDNHVAGAVYFNLNSSWNLGGKLGAQVFVQVNNLFDRAPPSAPQLQFPSNPVYFDLIGRAYRFGVRMKL